MWTFALRRLLLLIPTLIGITLVTFAVTRSIPTDPVVAVIGEQAAEHPDIVAVYRKTWGLDEPLPIQYLTYVKRLVMGDMGLSLFTHRPVADDLADYLPATIELATVAILISIVFSVPLGILAARLRGGAFDVVVRTVTTIGVSMPIFWLALTAINVFYFHLRIVPGQGRLDSGLTPPPNVTGLYVVDGLLAGDLPLVGNALAHLLLPALVLATWSIGLLTRVMRTSMLAVLHQDFLRTVRSKGGREFHVLTRHALGNAILPVVTVMGLAFGDLLAGSVMTETIFGWPGIGRYAYSAAAHADFPAIMGVTIVVALVYTVVNLGVDLFYAVIDPRIRAAMA
jgi:peptide/nickel transport system permease protein